MFFCSSDHRPRIIIDTYMAAPQVCDLGSNHFQLPIIWAICSILGPNLALLMPNAAICWVPGRLRGIYTAPRPP